MVIDLIIQELNLSGPRAEKIGLDAARARVLRTIELPGGLPKQARDWRPPEPDSMAAQRYFRRFSDLGIERRWEELFHGLNVRRP